MTTNTLAQPEPYDHAAFMRDVLAVTEPPLVRLLRTLGGDPERDVLVMNPETVAMLAEAVGRDPATMGGGEKCVCVTAYADAVYIARDGHLSWRVRSQPQRR